MNEIDERALLESEFLYLYQVDQAEKALRERYALLDGFLKAEAALIKAEDAASNFRDNVISYHYAGAQNDTIGKLYTHYLFERAEGLAKFAQSVLDWKQATFTIRVSYRVKDRHDDSGRPNRILEIKAPLLRMDERVPANPYNDPISSIRTFFRWADDYYARVKDSLKIVVFATELIEKSAHDQRISVAFRDANQRLLYQSGSGDYRTEISLLKEFSNTFRKDAGSFTGAATQLAYFNDEKRESLSTAHWLGGSNFAEANACLARLESLLKILPDHGIGRYEVGTKDYHFGIKENEGFVKRLIRYEGVAKVFSFDKFLEEYAKAPEVRAITEDAWRLVGPNLEEKRLDFYVNKRRTNIYKQENQSKYPLEDAIKLLPNHKQGVNPKLRKAFELVKEELARTNLEKAVSESGIFPPDYSTSEDIRLYMHLFFNKRADTVKELVNLAEEIRHRERVEGKLDALQSSVKDLTSVVKAGFGNISQKLDRLEEKVQHSLQVQRQVAFSIQAQTKELRSHGAKLNEILDQNERHYLGTIEKLNDLDERMVEVKEAIENIEINNNYYDVTYDYSTTNNYANIDRVDIYV